MLYTIKDIYFTGTNGRIVNMFADYYVSQFMVHDPISVKGLINAGLVIIRNVIL